MSSRISAIFAAALLSIPAVASAQSFSGPHAEAIVGWNHVDGPNRERSGDGVTYGGGIGYDLRSGQLVGGVMAEMADSSGSTCKDLLVLGTVDGTGCTHNGRAAFVGGRVGFVVGEHNMIYVLGGYVNVRQNNSYEGVKGGTMLFADFHDKRSRDGYRVGAGIERELAGKAFLKAEYRYTDIADGNVGSRQHQVTTGVGLRF